MREVIKRAKLFEAGEYPDKDLSVSESDLDEIVRTSGEVPLTVGHLDPNQQNPLRLGVVGNLYRKGKELFGVIRFAPEAWALALRSGAKYLSVCLDRLRKRLVEVSLVVRPRVPDAKVRMDAENTQVRMHVPFEFTEDERSGAVRAAIYSALGTEVWIPEVYQDYAIVERDSELLRVPYRFTRKGGVRLGRAEPVERRYVALCCKPSSLAGGTKQCQGDRTEVAERIGRWLREGRIAPANADCARRLLTFAEPEARRLFTTFVETQPQSMLLTQVTPFHGESDADLPELDMKETVLCERFGIPREEYRRMKWRTNPEAGGKD